MLIYRILSVTILLVMTIISLTLATESSEAHDGTHRIEWSWQGEDITSPSEPVAPPSATLPRRSFNPYEKTSIEITMEIRNYGDGGDNISMDGYSPDPRIKVNVTPAFTLLLHDQTKFIKVTIKVPESLHPGVYTLFLNASSEDPEAVTRVASLAFEVFNFDAKVPLFPTLAEPPRDRVVKFLSVLQGSNISFKLKVANNGTKILPGVAVRAFDTYMKDGIPVKWNFFNLSTPPIAVGDRFIVGEPPLTELNPPLYWWANVPGDHILEFRIFYEYQSVISNDRSSINITVTEPPEILDIEPATGATFKEGKEVTFRANATGGEGDVLDFTWMEGDEVLGSGPEFNTTDLAPGEHNITLIVDDGTTTTSHTFTITIERKEKSDGPGASAMGALFALMMLAVIIERRRVEK